MIKLYDADDNEIDIKFTTFNAGERNVSIIAASTLARNTSSVCIEMLFASSNDIVDLMLVVDAVREITDAPITLDIPYFPFSRQDRVMNIGEAHSLRAFVRFIRSLGVNKIITQDPHSDVLAGMFGAGELLIIPQHVMWSERINRIANHDKYGVNTCLVSPDAGANKKIYRLALLTNQNVVEASKHRDTKTGYITKTEISSEIANYSTVYIVDDICDGGRTFIELAKAIDAQCPCKPYKVLCITHGIFSNGIGILREYYDEVICINDMSDWE